MATVAANFPCSSCLLGALKAFPTVRINLEEANSVNTHVHTFREFARARYMYLYIYIAFIG